MKENQVETRTCFVVVKYKVVAGSNSRDFYAPHELLSLIEAIGNEEMEKVKNLAESLSGRVTCEKVWVCDPRKGILEDAKGWTKEWLERLENRLFDMSDVI
jgi:hypothetical protein